MSERRAKQKRRLERLYETGSPERHKVRARLHDNPQPGSWSPQKEAEAAKARCRSAHH